MRLLLDTHVLLWAVQEPQKLSASTTRILLDPENKVVYSAASIWEIAIKARRIRADFTARPERVAWAAREMGFHELLIDAQTASRVADLPLHHRDPFDRLLVAQAMAGPMRLFTADKILLSYSELVTLVG